MNEIMEALEQSELIIIHRHLRPDQTHMVRN